MILNEEFAKLLIPKEWISIQKENLKADHMHKDLSDLRSHL